MNSQSSWSQFGITSALVAAAIATLPACSKSSEEGAKANEGAKASTPALPPPATAAAKEPACPDESKDGWTRGAATWSADACKQAKLPSLRCSVHGDLDKWKAAAPSYGCKALINSNDWCCEK